MKPECLCLGCSSAHKQIRLELGLRCISTSEFKPSYLYSSADGGHSCEIKIISLLRSLAVIAVFGCGKPEPDAFLFAE